MFRQIGSTLGVALMGTIVAASASFALGLERAMLAAALLLAAGGIAVVLLARPETDDPSAQPPMAGAGIDESRR